MEAQISDLLQMLESDDVDTRIMAIEILGEIGDKQCLKTLRERLSIVDKELRALVIGVGKLKRKLGVK